MDEADKNISILKREVWCFLKSNDWTISPTWISYNMKVPPQLWGSPSKNCLSQTVATQTRAKKNAAFRWGHAFLMWIPWGIFMLPHSPALLSITRNSAPQLKSPKLSLKQLQNNPDLVGSVRLSSQERSELWETSLSWDVSPRRFGSLSQEPIAGKGASLLLLKLVLFFPPKVSWPCEPPPWLCPACEPQQQQDKLTGQGQEEQPPPCTSGPAHLCSEAGKGLCGFGLVLPQEWQGTLRTAQMQENTLGKSNKPIIPIACHA